MIDKKEPLRVLQLSAADFQFGGVEKFIDSYYENIDREQVQFDICFAGSLLSEELAASFQSRGARLFFFNMRAGGMRVPLSFWNVFKFLKHHPYQIVHVNNGGLSFHALASLACKLTGVQNVICHLHGYSGARTASGLKKAILKIRLMIDRWIVGQCATEIFTCSMELAKYNLGEKLMQKFDVKFIPNAFDTKKFSPDPQLRSQTRERLGIQEEFVFCHIGRFHPLKNHKFLLLVFKQITELHPASVLLLVGDGALREAMETLAATLGIEHKVKFLGTSKDVNCYLQASDVFVLPSKSEGLPISLLEAQCAGKACVTSDASTQEVNISKNVVFLSFNAGVQHWAEVCLEQANQQKKVQAVNALLHSSYEIETVGKDLQNLYVEYANRIKSKKLK